MSVRQFRYVLAVAELKSFGLAADKCFVTQSTLSTMVGKFEEEIGIQIFDRKTKPITVTKEGLEVVAQLRAIDNEILTLQELVQGMKGELAGEIKMGIIPTVAPYVLPEFLSDFAREFPKIFFKVSEMPTRAIEDQLENRTLDVGIFAIPIKNKNLVEVPLFNEPFVLYDCTRDPLKEVESLESLDYSKFWLLEEGHCLRSQVRNICESQSGEINVDANFDFRAGSIESLIRFVKMNNGITLLPLLACDNFSSRERKKLGYFKHRVPVRTIGLAVHRHFTKHKLLEELKRSIQAKVHPRIGKTPGEYVVSPLTEK